MARDLLAKLDRALPGETRDAVSRAVALAGERGVRVALVGGGVRDLLLGAGHVDVDLVVSPPDGSGAPDAAIELAEAVAAELGVRIAVHRRFGTATVRVPGGHLDLARARSERYERPGALPEVASASLEEDLARRDFTINAMALLLTPEAGELVDPAGGRADLAAKRVRVLHDGSFRDDATRILRALRYAGRFGFALEAATAAALERDLGYLDTIGGARLRRELERIASEERAGAIVAEAAGRGVLAAVHPALAGPPAVAEIATLPASHRDGALFCALLWRATPEQTESAIDRLALTGRQSRTLRDLVALRDDEARLAATRRPSEAVRFLDGREVAAIEAFALLSADAAAAECARSYVREWRHVRPRLSGHDVEALGVEHGPAVGEALARLRAARLDGEAESRDEEEALVRSLRPRALAEARRG